LTADQLSQFSTINTVGNPLDLVAAGAGTYDLTGKAPNSEMYLDARQTSANVTLIAGSQDAVLVSGAGFDTLIGGTGDDTFYRRLRRPATHRAPRDDRRADVGRYRWSARQKTQQRRSVAAAA